MIIISDKLEVPSSNISSIKKEDVNKAVKIIGTVNKAINKEKVATLELIDKSGSIEVVMFKPQDTFIKKGSIIEVNGKVSIKEDKPQIYAETVKLIN